MSMNSKNQHNAYEMLRGTLYLNEGEIDKALRSYRATLRKSPENLEALYGVGVILQKKQKFQEAKNYLEKALQIDDNNCYIWNNYGIVCANLKEYEDAIEAFKKSYKLNPTFKAPRQNLAEVYIHTGQFERGIEIYMDLISQNPQDVETLLGIAELYAAIEDFESTKFLLNRVLEIDPVNQFARDALEQLQKSIN